ncbi:unnamed protein product [Symbiodinium sp. CCMP2592]|nr:unnamed protein product [Symbiodinium sp. CCMP2592]
MKRQTPFHNWFTKVQDLQGAQLAAAWRVSLPVHLIRRQDYRGRKKAVMQFDFRRSSLDYEVLTEQLNGFLSCCHELQEYVLYLRSFPCRAAALCSAEATSEIRCEILKDAKEEYEMIREIEATASGSSVLKQHALHTTFQVYREIMATMQLHDFKDCKAIQDIVQAWYPRWGQSSSLEQVFREMEQATKRVGHVGNSMSNLTCVAVRAMERRVCCGEECPQTPSLCEKDWEGQVVRLKEVSWKFAGKLMPEKPDERRMPRQMKECKDPFHEQTDCTHALVMDSGNMFQHVRCGLRDVEIFEYTVHVSPASMESKCGGILLRRGPQAYSLLVHLFISGSIMNITSAALSEILIDYECRMPKNSSKHAKIRKLMTLADVKESLSDEGVAQMEAKLQEIEKNRSAKKKEKEQETDDVMMHDQEAEEEDPAVAACDQLLAELEKEEEDEEEMEEEKDEAADPRRSSVL